MKGLSDLKERFVDMMTEEMKGYELVYKPATEQKKVWILIIDSSTMREILGVYSCQEKAYQKYQKFLEHFSGASNYSGVVIIERELE